MKFPRWLGVRFGKESSLVSSRHSQRLTMRPHATGRRTPSVEPLEERRLLSVSLGQEEAQNITSPLLQAAVEISWEGETAYAEPGAWLARFDGIDGTPQEQIQAVQQLLDSVQPDVTVADYLGLDGLMLLRAPTDRTYESLLSPLQTLTGFEYIEPNLISASAAPVYPNDPLLSSLWGLDNTGQTVSGTPATADADIDAPEAWADATGSASVVVGIIDTGVDYTHPDLNDNIWINPGEIAGNGIDDDGNGYVDDIRGWDFVNNDNNPMDDHGHGTHVAGTIAAEGNNGIGVAGVNWDATIMPLKFLDSGGYGSTANAVKAVNYATWMRNHGVNICVTNNSWGGSLYEQSLKDAIQANAASGMLFVAAAGNSGRNNDATPNYPSGYDVDNVISVAASDPSDNLARSGYFGSTFYSNYGATTVDLAAPGVSIRSTVPSSGLLGDPSGYRYLNGTSMATPHVTGAAALAWSVDPTATYQEIRDLILSTVDTTPTLAGKVATGGRLNVERMLTEMGMHVVGSTPGANQIVTTPPTDFSIDFSADYDPATVQATDLTVNGLPADTYTLTDSDTVTFHFAVSPVVAYGLQTIVITDGAVSGMDGDEVKGWSTAFRYDHPAEIRGVKFEDVDGDGARDANEPAMAGVVVYLDADDDGMRDPEEAAQTTAADGSYAFAGLMPGNYVVREVVPETYRQTFPAITPGRLFSVNTPNNLIVELDPQTGGVLRQFATPYTAWSSQGLAFDGKSLYFLSDSNDLLCQLDPDTGAVVRQTALTAGSYDGLAVLAGNVYALDSSADRLQVIDPATGGLIRTLDLRAANPGIDFYGGLGEIAGPDSLVVTLSSTRTTEIAFIDPQTGRITSTFNHGQTATDLALTSLGQELFVGFSDYKIRVYNRSGVLQRTLSEGFIPFGLGGNYQDGSHRIALAPTEIRTGVDFGNQSALGEIRGTLFVDADADGLRDPDESAQAGVTVYVDLNNNRQLDADEPSQATSADGSYTFTGLMPGPYAVREAISADYRQSFPVVDGSVFLGAAYFTQTGTRQLVKIDAASGQVTRIGSALNVAISGLVVTIDGRIYGINSSDNAFYSIDSVTGQATRIGPSGFVLGGITYDRANDVIYGIGRQVAGDTISRLLIFDRTTGKATAIGPGIEGVTGTTGLAFDSEQGRILGFDNSDDEVYAFDTRGNGTRLPIFAANAYALAFAGRSLVMPVSQSSLGFVNPDLGVSTGSMPISESMVLEALEFVPGESNVRRVRLAPTQILSGIDFGNVDVRGEIQGTVFIDADGNGMQDPGEQLQTNVTVYLDLNDNNQLDSGEPTQMTDAEGVYRFTGVQPGGYSVRELIPADFQQTSPGMDSGFFYASIYTYTGGNRWQLAKIDAQTGQVERIGSPQTMPLRGLVETNDGRLYGIQGSGSSGSANDFYSVDPATGVMTRIGHLGFLVAPALGYDRGTDTIYGLGKLSSSDPYYRLLVIDRATGVATQCGSGPWTNGLTQPIGLTFDPVLGKVLAYDYPDREIYAFDVRTGTPELLTAAQGRYDSWSAAHNGRSLVLHQAWSNSLYYVDPATGATKGSLLMSESMALDALEMVPAVPYGHRVVVGSRETVTAAAFGNQSTLGDLRGVAFVDADADGVRDSGESGQAGVTVYLDQNNNGQLDSGELTAVTDQDGAYLFADIRPATYVVRQVVPDNYRQISRGPAVDTYYGATNGGQTLVQIDAVTGKISSLGPSLATAMHGIVTTYDGQIYGINGPNSSLYSINPTTGQATLLGPSGYLLTYGLAYDRATDTIYGVGKTAVGSPNQLLIFDRVTGAATAFGPGTLGLNATSALAFDAEHGRILAFDNADKEIYAFDREGNVSRLSVAASNLNSGGMSWNGTSAVLGTDNRLVYVNPDTGATVGELVLSGSITLNALDFTSADISSRVVTLPAAGSLNLVGFGNQYILGDLRGVAFVDADADGLRDSGESGQAGVTVYLDQNNNGQLDPGELTAVTDQDGAYLFASIRPATYVVRQVVPEGYRQMSSGPAVDTYYGAAVDAGQTHLVQIDATTGKVGPVGSGMSTWMNGIVVAYDGRIYGINGSNSSLYSIDPTTGQATLLGPSGYRLTYGLAYDRATDTIYGVGKTAIGNLNQLLVFDRVTGAATAFGAGTLGLNSTSALAFDAEHGRILAFDNADREIYAFDREGNVSRLSAAASNLSAWGMAWNGTSAVLGMGNRLVYVNPDTGATVGELVLSSSISLDALDFTSADFSPRVVTLPPAGSLNLVGFGNYSAPPTADAGGPYTAPEGSAIYLDATGSYDPEGVPLEYLWDLDGDGVFGETGVAAQRGDEVGAKPLFSAESLDDGQVSVALRVTDNAGNVDETTTSITVVNVAPTILSAEIVPDAAEEGARATVFLRFADPGVKDAHPITIDWGDGSKLVTTLPAGLIWQPYSHTYADDKPSGTPSDTYTVHVTVADDDGATADHWAIVERAQFRFANSYTFNDALTHQVAEFAEDGYTIRTASGNGFEIDGVWSPRGDGITSARVATPGETVTLSRDDGRPFTFYSLSVRNPDRSGNVAKRLTFTGVREDGSQVVQTLDYLSDFSGYPLRGFTDVVSVSWQASQEAGYSPSYRFTDVVAATQASQVSDPTITVSNVAPRITGLSVDQPVVDEGATVTLTGSFVDPGQQDTHRVVVDWGDGQTTSTPLAQGSRSFAITHSYRDDIPSGTAADRNVIHVTVEDDDGGSDTSGVAPTLSSLAWDFEEWALSTADSVNVTRPTKAGYTFNASFSVVGPFDPSFVGSTAMVSPQNQNIVLSKNDGGLFTLRSIDVAELPTPRNMPAYITYTGTRADGSTVVKSVQTDGQIGFQRITFDGFTDLVSLTWRGQDPVPSHYGGFHQFDNIVLEGWSNPIPSPMVTVNNVAPVLGGLNLSAATVDENRQVTLTGSFTDVGTQDAHSVLIQWGDGTSSTAELVQGAGSGTFTATHRYLDDDPSGTPSDLYDITASVTDDDGGQATAETSITVKNVAPSITGFSGGGPAYENSTKGLWMFFVDSPLDSHTVVIDWGDPNSPAASTFVLPATSDLNKGGVFSSSTDGATLKIESVILASGGVGVLVSPHVYADDGLADGNGTGADAYTLSVTIGDDDGGSCLYTKTGTITNVPPSLRSLAVTSPVSENGIATLSGTFFDPGTLDVHTLVVGWEDPNAPANSTFVIPVLGTLRVGDTFSSTSDGAVLTVTSIEPTSGAVGFRVEHQYLDDGVSPGNGTGADLSAISVTVSDDDGGFTNNSAIDLVTNGRFEDGASNAWNISGSGSNWWGNDGSIDPAGPGTKLPPISGGYDLVSAQSQSVPGTTRLYQTIRLPAEAISSATLSWSDRIRNYDGPFSNPGQQFRVVLRDEHGNLLQEVFSTTPGDPMEQIGPNLRSFDVTSVLQSQQGQFVQLSFEQEVAGLGFNVTLDDISLRVAIIPTVLVTNVAPTASILQSPLESPEGTTIALASQVVDPGTADTFTYAWSVTRDGQAYASGNEASFAFTPDDNGSYLVSLTVTDDDGGVSDPVESQIVVANVAPTATLTDNQSITYGESVAIRFSGVSDPSSVDTAAGFHYAYATSPTGFDGTTYANSSDTAEYDFNRLTAGDHTLYGRIIDKDGGFTQYSMEVHVERKAASVTPNAASKTYGDADPTLTGILEGFLEADAVLASYQRTAGETVLGGPYAITATLSPEDVLTNYSITYNTAEFTINPAPLAIIANDATKYFGHTLTFAGSEFTSSGLVNGDSVTSVALTSLGSPAAAPVGAYEIEASAAVGAGLSNYAITYTKGTLTVTLSPSGIVVLDPTVSGALTMSGNASIHSSGDVIVESSSTSGISLRGNAQLAADNILLAGAIQTSGDATYSGNVSTVSGLGDPLANLAAPSFVGTGAAVSVTGNSQQTLNPGVYRSIKVAGNGSLTLNPGVYIIAGGGISVTGNGSISGDGVFLYNTGSGSTYGGIALSGNGTSTLTAPADGPFAGILIFQDRLNTRAMSFSGNAAAGISGTVYAQNALVTMSGNAQATLSLVVDRLQVSGNGTAGLAIDGVQPEAATNAGELLAKDLYLYVDNSSGSFSVDALARLDEAIANLQVLLSSYNVSVAEITDRSVANVFLTADDSSIAGGYLDGVLGCYSETGEITLIQGWDWYTGVDPAAIGQSQYDFQTIVTHELGHALGLGHSNDANSTMYSTLDAAEVCRTISVADLNVPQSHEAVAALRALPLEAIKALAAATPLRSGLSIEATNIFDLSKAPAAVRLTDETAELPASDRGILDNRAVEAVFQSAYQEAEESIAYLSPKLTGDGESWMASLDRQTDILSDETAVDLAMQDFERLLADVGEGK